MIRTLARRSKLGVPVGTLLFGALGCLGNEQAAPTIEEVGAALEQGAVIGTVYDDSASPVHVQIRSCKTVAFTAVHQLDCRVDPEFAVIGGGAKVSGSSGGRPFVNESRPVDGRTWRGGSNDLRSLAHELTVYAIGLRLDGVNTQVLRDSIEWKSAQTTGSSLSSTIDADALLLGGGGVTVDAPGVTGPRLLTTTAPSGRTAWTAASKPSTGTVAGSTGVTLLQIDNQIIEGFGALQISHRTGTSRSTAGGSLSATINVDAGWAMIGLGGVVRTNTGLPSRMITSLAPCANGRCATLTSTDQNGTSGGTNVPYLTQLRKVPGSHGLCNPGTALATTMDTCVAQVCAQRGSCCSTSWDSTCVQMVEGVCGRSCAEHTCVRTVFEPERWNRPDGTAVASNCYYYAQNKYPDGINMDPGASLNLLPGEFAMSRLTAFAAGDGLIPTTFNGQCSENRTKVFLIAYDSTYAGYHWYRQDASGLWSDKFATWGLAQITPDTGVGPYHEVQNATYEQYYCACNYPLPPNMP